MPKSKADLEKLINGSKYFTIAGENIDTARTTEKARLVSNLWDYCKDRKVKFGETDSVSYQEFGEELWKAMEYSINNFEPDRGDTFCHFFNGYCKRFLQREIQRSNDYMSSQGLLLKKADIQRIKKIQNCKENIEKTGKNFTLAQKIEWIANLSGYCKEEVSDALEKENALYPVSGDAQSASENGAAALFEGIADSDSSFHKAIPTPEESLEIEEQRKENSVRLEAMEYIFTKKTKETQRPLLKQALSLEWAETIPPDASYSYIDNDILSSLKAGEEITRRAIAKSFYPEKSTNNAEAMTKVILDRFMKKAGKYLEKQKNLKNGENGA